MYTNLHFKKKICFGILLWVGMLFTGFSAFSQNQNIPYNIVMNSHGSPTTQMAFNWFTGAGVTGGVVKIMLNGNTITVPVTYKYTQRIGYVENKAVVTGLTPNTTYSFQVGGVNNYWSAVGTFTTAKNNKDPFSFIYVTDSQVRDTAMLRTNSKAAFTQCPNAKFWLHCGDLV